MKNREKYRFRKKIGFGSGYEATEMWVWCGLYVVMFGVVGILSVGEGGRRVLRCDEGIYEDVVSGEDVVKREVGLSVICGWEYIMGEEVWREERDIVWDVASYEGNE